MTEKSILEQALLQINTLEEAVKQNAKGILASTMKQELNEMLKESLEEEEDVVANEEEEEETSEETSMEEQGASEEEEEDEIPADDADDLGDLDNDETEGGSDELDSEMEDEMGDEMDDEESDMEDEMEDEMDDEMGDEDALDLTGASDEEVMKVFKAMKPEDGIIVKKNEDSVEFSDGENEYLIKLDEEEEEMSDEEMSDEEMYEEEMDEESVYEIELDEEEEEEEEETHEEEMEEAARTKSNPHGNKGGADRAGLPSKKTYKAGSGVVNEDYQNLLSEVEKLKKQNAMYKEAVVLFKEKLNEIAVFNASLAYSNRLFTEHSTTKQEKMNILKRFDAIQTIEESKSLFKTIKSELDNKKPVTESVVEKIVANPTTSSSQEMLSESKAYENPQFKRMKDLMSKIK